MSMAELRDQSAAPTPLIVIHERDNPQIDKNGMCDALDGRLVSTHLGSILNLHATTPVFNHLMDSAKKTDDLLERRRQQREAREGWYNLVESRLIGWLTLEYCSEEIDVRDKAHQLLAASDSPFALTRARLLGGRPIAPVNQDYRNYNKTALKEKRPSLTGQLVVARATAAAEHAYSASLSIQDAYREAARNLRGKSKIIGLSKEEAFAFDRLVSSITTIANTKLVDRKIDLSQSTPLVRDALTVGWALMDKPEHKVGDRIKDRLKPALGSLSLALQRVERPIDLVLFDENSSNARIIPWGVDENNPPIEPGRDRVVIEDPEAIAAREAAIHTRRQEVFARRAAEAAEAERRDTEKQVAQARLRQELTEISELHNELLAPFSPVVGRTAREKHLSGSENTLPLALYNQLGGKIKSPLNLAELQPIAYMIDSLLRVCSEPGEGEAPRSAEWLTATLERATELRGTFDELKRQSNNNVDITLVNNVAESIDWIRTNWNDVEKAIKTSKYTFTEEGLVSLKKLLGLSKDDEVLEATPFEPTVTPTDDNPVVAAEGAPAGPVDPAEEAHELSDTMPITAFEQVEALCKQLGWVVLPPETDRDSLGEDIKKYIRALKIEVDADAIREGRMGILLDLYAHFKDGNARLYRSAKPEGKILDGLYYLLLFEHDGDVYGIAENPVYKNATYVARQGLTPLLDHETVLEVFRLTKNDARFYGARQLVHDEAARGATDPQTYTDHLRLIIHTVYELSQQQTQ